MTLYLENTSEKKSIALRYGDGNNFMLQLNAKERKPLPLEITKQKLQSYLHLFKDLRLVDDTKKEKVEKITSVSNNLENDNPENKQSGEENNLQSSNDTIQTLQGSDDGNTSDNQNTSTEEVDNNGQPDDETKQPEDESIVGEGDETKQPEDESIVGEGDEGESSIQSTENAEGDNEPVVNNNPGEPLPVYTEKELNNFKAGVIKEIAAKWGIEVTDESTKKALIPVILDKQGN
jgi:hypothetical protein